jgi:(+)-trans-carveol dehydrogenase
MRFSENTPSQSRLFMLDVKNLSEEEFGAFFEGVNLLPVKLIEPIAVSSALLFQASDEARYITGVQLPADAGWQAKP